MAGAVIIAGAVLLAVRLPAMHFDQPLLFLALLAASIVISVSKISLPIVGGTATLSMSYFTDLLAVMLVGADQAMLVAGDECDDPVLRAESGRDRPGINRSSAPRFWSSPCKPWAS